MLFFGVGCCGRFWVELRWLVGVVVGDFFLCVVFVISILFRDYLDRSFVCLVRVRVWGGYLYVEEDSVEVGVVAYREGGVVGVV